MTISNDDSINEHELIERLENALDDADGMNLQASERGAQSASVTLTHDGVSFLLRPMGTTVLFVEASRNGTRIGGRMLEGTKRAKNFRRKNNESEEAFTRRKDAAESHMSRLAKLRIRCIQLVAEHT